MKRDAGVRANALLAGAKSSEILGGFGDDVVVELHHYPPFQLPSDAYVEKAPRPTHLRSSAYNAMGKKGYSFTSLGRWREGKKVKSLRRVEEKGLQASKWWAKPKKKGVVLLVWFGVVSACPGLAFLSKRG
nr:hypothetical protein Iba_chr05eCG11910 [Ipomoea batatas]